MNGMLSALFSFAFNSNTIRNSWCHVFSAFGAKEAGFLFGARLENMVS